LVIIRLVDLWCGLVNNWVLGYMGFGDVRGGVGFGDLYGLLGENGKGGWGGIKYGRKKWREWRKKKW